MAAQSEIRRPAAEPDNAAQVRQQTWLRKFFTSQFVLANETTTFIMVTSLDFFVTYLMLAWPDSPAYEANPIARRMLQWGFRYLIGFKFGMATVAVVSCELIARQHRRLGRWLLIVLTLIVAGVAGYGLRLLAQHILQI